MNHMSDDAITDAIAKIFGMGGFDMDEEHNLERLAGELTLDEGQEAVSQDTLEDLDRRVRDLLDTDRLIDVGCGWIGISPPEWCRRLAGKTAEEIYAALAGEDRK